MLVEGGEIAARGKPGGAAPDGRKDVAARKVTAALAKLEHIVGCI